MVRKLMQSVGKPPKLLNLLCLPLLRVVLAVTPALLAPAGSSSGEVVPRLVQFNRVRNDENSRAELA